MTRIAIIPARSGSKGLPDKNILPLLGKPLIAYTIEAAVNSGVFDHVIVSTDSLQYKSIAEEYGAQVILRGEDLSSDNASSFMVIQHVLSLTEPCDAFMLLQPTSPLRHSGHIVEAVDLFNQHQHCDFLVSMAESPKSSFLINSLDEKGELSHFSLDLSQYRRQAHKEYTPNGAIYIAKPEAYLSRKHFFGEKSLAYIMDKESSVDIDDWLDFELAAVIAAKRKK